MFTCRMFTSAFKYEAEELLRQRKLGFSFVRLLPKDTGVRPIVNLRRKRVEIDVSQTTCHAYGILDNVLYRNLQGKTNVRQQSINDILQAAFQHWVTPDWDGVSNTSEQNVTTRIRLFAELDKERRVGHGHFGFQCPWGHSRNKK
jgi:hypothetical protein